MIKDLLKWVLPGTVTVLGGTVAALAMSSNAMTTDLSQRSDAILRASGADWAHVAFTSRNAHLSGTVPSAAERDRAIARITDLSGVRSVEQSVTIAPLANPYRIDVSVEDGVLTLSGSVPDNELRDQLSALPGVTRADLHIRSGQPDENQWQQGVQFAVEQASRVSTGHFVLTGLKLEGQVTAGSDRDLGELQMALAARPAGIELGNTSIQPVRVNPYTWSADFDGQRIAISGHVPADGVLDRIRTAEVSGIPIATGVSLASGAPEGFAELSRTLVEQLSRLDNGHAEISGDRSQLVGTPPNVQVAQAVTDALSGTGSIVKLDPPSVSDYWIRVTRQEGGVIVFDGYAPDAKTKDKFSRLDNADVAYLKLGGGAPATYQIATEFGLDLLGHFAQGRFALHDNALSVSGTALSASDFRAVLDKLKTGLPQGVKLAENDVKAPPAANYSFTITRNPDGGTVLSGNLPGPDLEDRLLALAGAQSTSSVSYASGEPVNFATSAEQAMHFLPWLSAGNVTFADGTWTVSGAPASRIDKGAIETEFAVRGLINSNWSLALTDPAATESVTPYTWSVQRAADGSLVFSGHVPAASLQSYLVVHANAPTTDNSEVAPGAPEGFADAARAALDAVLLLDEGEVRFDGKSWSLSGTAADPTERDLSIATLRSVVGEALGAEISVPEAAPAEPYLWTATRSSDGEVKFTGAVPATSMQKFLVVRAGSDVVDETTVRPDAPDDFSRQVLNAVDSLALLSQGTISFDGTAWSARGQGREPGTNAAISEILGTSANDWTVSVSDGAAPEPEATAQTDETVKTEVQPMPEAAPEPQAPQQDDTPASAPETPAAPAPGEDAADNPAETAQPAAPQPQPATPAPTPNNFAFCDQQLAALSAENAILFQSGAAIIADSAGPELDAFAQVLAQCPNTDVHVEGHTDSDGDARLNLALSVARAEAVVNALAERGISVDRLYAIGYGESQPVADNATAAGKRQNRRIVVTVVPPSATAN